jgi:hypothetical protein
MTTTHPPRRSPELARAAAVTAAIAAAAAVLLLALAGWLVHQTATYVPAPHEDTSLHGLGYVIAAVVGVPAGVAALLAAGSFVLARRRRGGPALGLAVTALAIMVPVALMVLASVGLG